MKSLCALDYKLQEFSGLENSLQLCACTHIHAHTHTHTQVRLPLLQPSFLCDCVGRERVVEESPRAMRLVMEAMEYHLLPERRANIKSLRTQPRSASSKVQVGKEVALF